MTRYMKKGNRFRVMKEKKEKRRVRRQIKKDVWHERCGKKRKKRLSLWEKLRKIVKR